jgi:general secretion pathway protein B
VWILLAVLSLNALLLTFVLWPESASKLPPVSAPVPIDMAARPPVSPPLPVEAAPDRAGVQQPVPPRQPLPRRQAPATVSAPAVVAPPLRALPALSEPLRSEPRVSEVVEGDGFAAPVVSEPEAAPVPPPPVVAAVNRGDNNLPVWPQVSDQLFREINSDLRLDVHVYSDQPHERFVLLNMRKYHEGERLQEGPVVDAITPGGVTLSFRGQRFRMQSQ